MTDNTRKKWWKKGNSIIVKTQTKAVSPTTETKPKVTSKLFLRHKKGNLSQSGKNSPAWASATNLPQIKNPSTLSENEITQIQNDLYRVTQQRNQLEHELNLRAKQVKKKNMCIYSTANSHVILIFYF